MVERLGPQERGDESVDDRAPVTVSAGALPREGVGLGVAIFRGEGEHRLKRSVRKCTCVCFNINMNA